MQKLVFTKRSPGSRAVRIVLDELGMEFEPVVIDRGAGADITPAMQVPCLIDNGRTLWEAPLIIEYLLSKGGHEIDFLQEQSERPLSPVVVRSEHVWDDKLALASVQTFGTSVATIRQMRQSGVRHSGNAFLERCAERLDHLLDWFEGKIHEAPVGLFKETVAIQDVLLVCWLGYIDHRLLDINWRSPQRPKVHALFEQLTARQSFGRNPIEWREPD